MKAFIVVTDSTLYFMAVRRTREEAQQYIDEQERKDLIIFEEEI